ncbi:MAG: ATP-binding protein [Acetobacteraceae bacterium]
MGRNAELNALSQCWLEAKGGAGRVVLLVGEPGIGKSRLVVNLMDRLSGVLALKQAANLPARRSIDHQAARLGSTL